MLDLHQAARPHDVSKSGILNPFSVVDALEDQDTEMSRAMMSLRWGVERLDDELSSFERA